MQGFDRCIVLSAQVFTAFIPLFIVVASAAPAGEEDLISEAIIRRFALSGESAAAVEQLFTAPPGATSSVTVFSALLLLYSGVAFTRRLQRTYRSAWEQEKLGIRSTLFATLGLVVLIVEVLVASSIRPIVKSLPGEWLWTVLLTASTGLVVWTSIPYLLLDRQVHWRRLLVTGGLATLSMTILAIATPIYMPETIERYTQEFGLFGVTIAIIGWLLIAAGALVASAAIGAEFDASNARWLVRLKVRFRLLDPDVPPPIVPAKPDGRGLTSSDLLVLARILVNWLIMAAAVWIATTVVPGIDVQGGFGIFLWVTLVLGLVNAVLGPILLFLVGSQSWMTLGGSALLVNAILLAVTAGLSSDLDIAGFGSALLGALVIAVTVALLELVFRPRPSI
jgi:membrane protein